MNQGTIIFLAILFFCNCHPHLYFQQEKEEAGKAFTQ